jgi:hypothetical protein
MPGIEFGNALAAENVCDRLKGTRFWVTREWLNCSQVVQNTRLARALQLAHRES